MTEIEWVHQDGDEPSSSLNWDDMERVIRRYNFGNPQYRERQPWYNRRNIWYEHNDGYFIVSAFLYLIVCPLFVVPLIMFFLTPYDNIMGMWVLSMGMLIMNGLFIVCSE